MAARISVYEKDGKSFPTISLKSAASDKFFFTFGLNKARLIVENIEEIRKFVQDNKNPPTSGK